MGNADTSNSSLADKLNHLFETVYPADRATPYSNKEIAAAIRADGGSISDVYIWQLRTGRRRNPTKDHLEALAVCFGVSPAYFFDDDTAERTIVDLRTLEMLRRLQAQQVSLRSVLEQRGLSVESQRLIQQLVDRCLDLENLAGESNDDGRAAP